MSDSDDDSLQNVLMYQNENTTFSARGPHQNSTNITGLSFRNNVLTSTMHMPYNFERQRYGGSNFDQRSMYYRRETSPISLRSVPDYRPRNFNHSTYQNGMGSQRSIFNGRGGSPTSIRSNDTTASISAADIVFAFKNVKFNKYDLKVIKDGYHKLIKTRQRKRIEKRRNLKLFLKGAHRKSGGDSGEQGSNSSLSSDDGGSTKSTICKENIPGLSDMRSVFHFTANKRDHPKQMMDMYHNSTNVRENPIFPDGTESIKQKTTRNMFSVSSSIPNPGTKERIQYTKTNDPLSIKVNTSIMTQKERFKKGFLLPSQRFNNKSTTGQNYIDEMSNRTVNNKLDQSTPAGSDNDSNQEDIFKGFSAGHKDILPDNNLNKKRTLDAEDVFHSDKKRSKLNSPKNSQRSASCRPTHNKITDDKTNEFNFAKPKVPIMKGKPTKGFGPQQLLGKSRVLPIAQELNFNCVQNSKSRLLEKDMNNDIEDDTQSDLLHSTSEVSMRPSFIKRKLFTQKLDVAENKNVSCCDSLGTNSPQNVYSASIREKNKTRKLVSSQSCLGREVLGDDNIVLDLIHKIVPPDQINITNIANKTDLCNKSNNVENSGKWDVTSVIANCDDQDVSDTYTDEEIFNHVRNVEIKSSKNSTQNSKKVTQCKVVLKKLNNEIVNKSIKNNNYEPSHTKLTNKVTESNKKTINERVNTFWDTDFESDMEFNPTMWKNNVEQNRGLLHQKRDIDLELETNRSKKKANISKGTIMTVRNFHKKPKLSNTMMSHISPTIRDKQVTELSEPKSIVEGQKSTIIGKTNTTSQTGIKKTEMAKQNVPVNIKKEESRRERRTRKCLDCNLDQQNDTFNTPKRSSRLTIKNGTSDNNKAISHNYRHPQKVPQKSKDFQVHSPPECNSKIKQTNKDASNKNVKCNQKITAKPLMNSVRQQPHRKSKENSFTQSKAKTNNKFITKSISELASKNTSLNSSSSMTTKSRDKLSLISSGYDQLSMDLSNISNRTFRFLQRAQKSINNNK